MPAVILDACGTLNLYASGRFVPILTALRHEWYLPAAVERESQQYRQPDPADPEKLDRPCRSTLPPPSTAGC